MSDTNQEVIQLTPPPSESTKPAVDKSAFQALLEVDEKERTAKARQARYLAYIWSILLPPIGIYYFCKYLFFSDRSDDDVKAGITALVLTLASLLLSIWIIGYFFQQTTSLIPSQGSDVLRELITPANQKSLKELYQ
ncbi:hypothetical protein M1523_00155 [Patescibacteria group bacterium]|nr:hypothetical protein [Patescibacteria group bacterium]MCL5091951.1 hypothetical protein [Patescibacteria group bacterium]